MTKKLIVVADDFGFSEAFNYGVISGFERGIVTTASLMSNMEAAVHAAALARMHPRLCVTQHTNLVQGYCCADPTLIPSIAQGDRKFYRSGEYKGDGVMKKGNGTRVADTADVKRETVAQLERFKALMGYYPMHLEGHSIIQEGIMKAYAEVGEERGIHAMTFDDRSQKGFLPAHEFIGDEDINLLMKDYYSTGLTPDMLIGILGCIKKNPHEVNIMHCHPGYVDSYIMDNSTLVLPRCRDLQTLCDTRVKEFIDREGIELIGFDAIKL
ncbi:MAG: ChbG/HpnK family deacetylase [Treponema sp.]|jgi:predicted glycoside hydrolase/deacetylase ChbG (UPF0249 family)|nr:ChbG/HpnK family deacetylase [Treponema sp.]